MKLRETSPDDSNEKTFDGKKYGRNAWDYGLFHHHHHNHHHHHQTTKSWIVGYFFIFLVSFGRHDVPCFQKKPGQPKYKPLSKGPMVILAFIYVPSFCWWHFIPKTLATNSHPLRQVSLSNWEKTHSRSFIDVVRWHHAAPGGSLGRSRRGEGGKILNQAPALDERWWQGID